MKLVTQTVEAGYDRSRLRGGELLVTLVGSIGQAAIAPAEAAGFNVARAVGVVPIADKLDALWASYLIISPDVQDFIHSRANTTVQTTLNLRDLSSLQLPYPPKATRQAIVDLLSTFSERILLNRRMVDTLEGMAQALFQSWFLNTDPTLDELPEGWVVRSVGEVFDIVAGNTPSTEQATFWGGSHAWATPKDLSRLDAPILLAPERALTDAGLSACSSGLLPTGTLLLSSRAPIGYLAFIQQPTAINQGIAAFRRKEVSTSYAWAWCHANMHLINASANGSTFPEISKGVLRKLPMVVAPDPIMHAFAGAADPLVARIAALVRQNDSLVALRDSLLPKLISGELLVQDAGSFVMDV